MGVIDTGALGLMVVDWAFSGLENSWLYNNLGDNSKLFRCGYHVIFDWDGSAVWDIMMGQK